MWHIVLIYLKPRIVLGLCQLIYKPADTVAVLLTELFSSVLSAYKPFIILPYAALREFCRSLPHGSWNRWLDPMPTQILGGSLLEKWHVRSISSLMATQNGDCLRWHFDGKLLCIINIIWLLNINSNSVCFFLSYKMVTLSSLKLTNSPPVALTFPKCYFLYIIYILLQL